MNMPSWAIIALVLGAAAPLLLMPRAIAVAFREKGMLGGLMTWIGAATLPAALLLGLLWAQQRFF